MMAHAIDDKAKLSSYADMAHGIILDQQLSLQEMQRILVQKVQDRVNNFIISSEATLTDEANYG